MRRFHAFATGPLTPVPAGRMIGGVTTLVAVLPPSETSALARGEGSRRHNREFHGLGWGFRGGHHGR